MPNGQQPIFILKEGTERSHGRVAQSNNIAAAKAVADAVRSTLGPKGMDKMLVDEGGDVIITNDGATILGEMDIDHPAAKMIIEVAKTQEQECYDGTTSAVVLSGELLKKSEELITQNIHPTIICSAFRDGGQFIAGKLEEYTQDSKDLLLNIATTSLTGKSSASIKEHLGNICVDAVEALSQDGAVDLTQINVVKAVGGDAHDSELISGIIVDKERAHSAMPASVSNGKVLLIDFPLEVKSTEMDANIQITDPNQITAFLEQEEGYIRELVRAIVDSGATIVVCQKGIDDLAKHYLSKAGVFALEKVKRSDMEALSRATGAGIINNLEDVEDALGSCETLTEKKVGELPMSFFSTPNSSAVTLLLRGGTAPFVEEIERAFDDAVGVVAVAYEDGQVLTGGGSIYASLSRDLADHALTIGGRDRMALEAFSQALEVIPRTLAENGGLDPVDEMMALRKAHAEGNHHHGVNVFTGGVMHMGEAGVYEPKRVVAQALKSAVETATMILRIDDVISSRKAGPRQG